ncbi:UNKNOWN [Stylonychia lemnae]|uniref:Uncharacterized protein n=1 Tax=Stylonychia lemnae TaxID=5949 RepID=A0A078A3W8_STYLE|nr:UNKNOWN [Stylonychia lemnae]|eukprot:CDW76953.1 UNKNOWN [Stylonychia lemnae]
MVYLLQLRVLKFFQKENFDDKRFCKFYIKLFKKLYDYDKIKYLPPRFDSAFRDLAAFIILRKDELLEKGTMDSSSSQFSMVIFKIKKNISKGPFLSTINKSHSLRRESEQTRSRTQLDIMNQSPFDSLYDRVNHRHNQLEQKQISNYQYLNIQQKQKSDGNGNQGNISAMRQLESSIEFQGDRAIAQAQMYKTQDISQLIKDQSDVIMAEGNSKTPKNKIERQVNTQNVGSRKQLNDKKKQKQLNISLDDKSIVKKKLSKSFINNKIVLPSAVPMQSNQDHIPKIRIQTISDQINSQRNTNSKNLNERAHIIQDNRQQLLDEHFQNKKNMILKSRNQNETYDKNTRIDNSSDTVIPPLSSSPQFDKYTQKYSREKKRIKQFVDRDPNQLIQVAMMNHSGFKNNNQGYKDYLMQQSQLIDNSHGSSQRSSSYRGKWTINNSNSYNQKVHQSNNQGENSGKVGQSPKTQLIKQNQVSLHEQEINRRQNVIEEEEESHFESDNQSNMDSTSILNMEDQKLSKKF